MKKLLAMLLALSMLITCTFALNGCCCGLSEDDIPSEILDSVDDVVDGGLQAGTIATEPKLSPYEQLKNYIEDNGTYYEGSYVVSRQDGDQYFSMSVDDGTMYWYYSYDDSDMIVEIEENASSLSLLYECELSYSTYQCTGVVYPSTYTTSDPTIYSFSSDVSSSIEDTFKAMCESFTVLLFLQAKQALPDAGLTIRDFGFTNM